MVHTLQSVYPSIKIWCDNGKADEHESSTGHDTHSRQSSMNAMMTTDSRQKSGLLGMLSHGHSSREKEAECQQLLQACILPAWPDEATAHAMDSRRWTFDVGRVRGLPYPGLGSAKTPRYLYEHSPTGDDPQVDWDNTSPI